MSWWDTPAWLRAATGVAYGSILPMLLVPLAAGNVNPLGGESRPTLAGPFALLVPLLSGFVLIALLLAPPSRVVFDTLAWLVCAAFAVFIANFVLTLRGLPRIWQGLQGLA